MEYICEENGTCPEGKEICCYTCEDYANCHPANRCIIPEGRDFVKCATAIDIKYD